MCYVQFIFMNNAFKYEYIVYNTSLIGLRQLTTYVTVYRKSASLFAIEEELFVIWIVKNLSKVSACIMDRREKKERWGKESSSSSNTDLHSIISNSIIQNRILCDKNLMRLKNVYQVIENILSYASLLHFA